MRSKYVPYIIIGIVLVYLSIFGLEGFGLSLTGTPEDFTSYTKVDPGGYLSVTSQSVTATNLPRSAFSYVYKDFGAEHFGDFELQFESQLSSISAIEGPNAFYILILANNIGASSKMSALTLGVCERLQDQVIEFQLGDGRVSTNLWKPTDPFAMYYFDLSRTGSLATLSIFTSSTYTNPVKTMTCTISDEFQYLYVAQSGGYSSTSTVSGKVQNLRIAGAGPPTTGTLRVFASYQGSYIATSVTVSGPESKSGMTTTDANNPLKFELTPGTYTVSGTYNSVPVSQTVSVAATQTSDATLNFGGTTPLPPPPTNGTILDQILAKIKEIFRTPTVQQLLLVVGVGMAGIGGIMFILPEKKQYSPPPPPRYY